MACFSNFLKFHQKSALAILSSVAVVMAISGCQQEKVSTTERNISSPETTPAAEVKEAIVAEAPQSDLWKRDCEADIDAIKVDIEKLEAFTGPFTIDGVLNPLNDIEVRISDGASVASLMENVHPTAELREHASACTTAYADLMTQLGLSRGVYDAVSQVDTTEAAADIQRFHALTMQDFKLSGVDKDEETREKIRALNDKITRLGQEFDKNILEDVRFIEVDPTELDGLPADYIASKVAEENGKIRLSTRYVDTIPVYTYVHSDEVRKMLRQQDRSRGYPLNEKILKDLLIARHELANLLGFNNFADFITNDKMIGSAENANAFIQRIHDLAVPAEKRDLQILLERLQKIDPEATQVERWQTNYLEELVRREKYNIDATELRQYFTYGKAQQGIFDLVEHMFDVEIKPWQTEAWHEAVKAYEMYQDDELIGRFYLDMHPRDGKYNHAAAFSYQIGIEGKQIPIAALVCNFAGGEDPNAPMEFDEVDTFLHEFGHLLHSLFGGHQRWARISGITTEWDFVEAPSQMLEEWIYDLETLQTFAVNAEGQPIPKALVDNLKAARQFGEGVGTNVQMYYAALSLDYHRLDPNSFNLVDKMIELEDKYSPYPHQEETYFFANLGHLNGYSAIYYTYMWSKVIAIDMFSEFEHSGLRDQPTAAKYRDSVLVPGGLKPAANLVEDFLGRPYNYEAFSARLSDQQAE